MSRFEILPMDVPKIVAAGRAGAERAALDWAIAHGISHGGWCAKGRIAEDGPIPLKYDLQEAPSADELQLAEWNIRDCDGLAVFTVGNIVSESFRKAVEVGLESHKPLLHVSAAGESAHDALKNWVAHHSIKVLYVAGPRASEEPEVAAFVWDTLEQAFPSPSHSALPNFHLRAAQGWLELGNPDEAHRELDQLEPLLRQNSDVLEMRWHLYAHTKNWPACLDVAGTLFQNDPGRAQSWIHRSFALHELKRTVEAFECLLPVADKFPRVWAIPYNLSCYCAQLGRLAEARRWFNKALAIDQPTVQQAGKEDPDLKPLWDNESGAETN